MQTIFSGSGTGGSNRTEESGWEGAPVSPVRAGSSPIRPAASSSRRRPRCGSPSSAQASTTRSSSSTPARAPSPASKVTSFTGGSLRDGGRLQEGEGRFHRRPHAGGAGLDRRGGRVLGKVLLRGRDRRRAAALGDRDRRAEHRASGARQHPSLLLRLQQRLNEGGLVGGLTVAGEEPRSPGARRPGRRSEEHT